MQKIGFILLAVALLIGVTFTATHYSQFGFHSAQNTNGNAVDTNGNPVGANGVAGMNGMANGTANGTAGANGVAGSNGTMASGVAGTAGANSGTSGTVTGANGSTSGKPGEANKTAETKPVKQNDCFAYEYHHTEAAAGKDIEDYLDYTNAFVLEHGPVNPKSVCVKVNQKPVKFKMAKYKGQPEIQIGSVVGPESVIRVSYCVGQAPCKEACAVKANRFMDDLTADNDDQQDTFKESWDAGNKNKKELEANAKELRTIASTSDTIANQSVIREWETLKKQEWVCTK
jgi:hypothetical protein